MLSVELYEARIPMGRPFRHALKARTASASVLVAVRGEGADGWGEAAPREYVTGESVESVVDALARVPLPGAVAELDRLPLDEALAVLVGLRLPEVLGRGGEPAPAAAAGLETALFDFVCRRHGVAGFRALHRAGFGDVLAQEPAPAPVATVLDLGRDPVAYLAALLEADSALIPHVKLKAGPDVAEAAALVGRVRALLPAATVSVDANGAWETDDVLKCAGELTEAGLSWLEEPLAPRRWRELAALRRAGLMVMLDESFSSAQDIRACLDHQAADLVNLRVSKCGGPLRLLTLARTAKAAGLGVQLGVQVGEVGPLWAAGRLIGTGLGSAVAVEAGRQDEWFGPELTRPAYHVDRRTSRAPALSGPGLGLEPTPELLGRCVPRAVRKVGEDQ
ncbi:enolase C-terminal domain-like protein [Streptomyces sp. NPDC015127]|uniref:enolase C-terminal domain-like protein n=1 Tax=Streptomyces sp. NPDC015127 TaxID=3364939 RepID=UPI0036F7B949